LNAIELDEGYEVAAVFPQFVASATLEALKNRTRPLAIPLEHDSETLEAQKTVYEDHLHIIVEQPHTGESIACSISSANL
jgi:hypothetical protein